MLRLFVKNKTAFIKEKRIKGRISAKIFKKRLCIRFDALHRRGNRAGGYFKAPSWHTEQIRLVLLYPYPDTVHGRPLHETLISTLLTECNRPYDAPGRTYGLAIADCKFRAPLTPHLAQPLYFITKAVFMQVKKSKKIKKVVLKLIKAQKNALQQIIILLNYILLGVRA